MSGVVDLGDIQEECAYSLQHMAVDRCDVQYEVNVLARQMKAPTERSWMQLVRQKPAVPPDSAWAQLGAHPRSATSNKSEK